MIFEIPPEGLENFKKHKYISGTLTPFEKYFYTPFWNIIV